jgi:hypothetical protein
MRRKLLARSKTKYFSLVTNERGSGLKSSTTGTRAPRGPTGQKIMKLHKQNPTTRRRIFKRIEAQNPMLQSDRSDEIDCGVLELLAVALRLRRRNWVRPMDVARGAHVYAALGRLIERGFAIARDRPGKNPWNSEFGSSRRTLQYKISDLGLEYLSRLESKR